MTCIAAVVTDNGVVMGGDSAGVAGYQLQTRADPKVFRREKFLIGICGSFRVGHLLRFSLSVPEQATTQTDYEFMCTTFIDSVIECLASGGAARNDKGEFETTAGFLVAYKKKLYIFDIDFQLGIPLAKYSAVGCGNDIALGSPFSTEGQDPKKRVLTALKAAAEYSAGVRGPFKVLSQ